MRFKTYYKYYILLHTHASTRLFHYIGNIATLVYVIAILSNDISLWWLLLTPLVVYPFAWFGHFFFEKNRPAAFSNPIKAKMADWKMMWDRLIRRKS
jgi:hypothetical protein